MLLRHNWAEDEQGGKREVGDDVRAKARHHPAALEYQTKAFERIADHASTCLALHFSRKAHRRQAGETRDEARRIDREDGTEAECRHDQA